jgi:hypothetical protein
LPWIDTWHLIVTRQFPRYGKQIQLTVKHILNLIFRYHRKTYTVKLRTFTAKMLIYMRLKFNSLDFNQTQLTVQTVRKSTE